MFQAAYYNKGSLWLEKVALNTLIEQVGTPFYAYSAAYCQGQFQAFKKAFEAYPALKKPLICFAVKSNPNLALLQLFASEGAGADIVSLGELKRALKAGIPVKKILFSGVGKTEEEIAYALDQKIAQFNVESEAELVEISRIATQKGVIAPISLRVNPDVAAKTLKGISTGKKGDKFGIAWNRIPEVFDRMKSLPSLDVRGIDLHIGSQILNAHEYRAAYERARDLIKELRSQGHSIHHLDLGGGLGVPYKQSDTPISLDAYAGLVHEIFGSLEVDLAFEPGRFLVANSGVLVSKVLYLKKEPAWSCLIIDAAMNDLARPAIYEAYHEIVPLTQPQENGRLYAYDVVGPICESTDTFAKKRKLPLIKQGEYVALLSAGAYGASMSSTYNSRLTIPEVLVQGDQWHVIRKRPSYEELWANEVML
jgi:diaminopimelate decarboxylase